MADAVKVKGLRELQRAFRAMDKSLEGDIKDTLLEAAAPVRSDAQALASGRISGVSPGDPWAGMRIGIARSVVYIAPVERGINARGGQRFRRPRFGTKLMDEAMQPALDANVQQVEQRLDHMIEELVDAWEGV